MNQLKESLRKSEDINPFPNEKEAKVKKETKDGNVSIKEEKLGKKENPWKRFKKWFTALEKKKKVLFILAVLLGGILLLSLLTLLFKLDAYIFPSSVAGTVYNHQHEVVEGAKVCIKDKCTNTAGNGSYVIGGFKYGDATVTVIKEDYKDYETVVELQKGRINFDVILEPAGYGAVKAVLIVDSEDYDFSTLTVHIDEELVEVSENGEVDVSDLAVGDYVLKIESPDFKDEEIEFTIEEELNDMGEIELSPAGDLNSAIVDWLNKDALKGAKLTIDSKEYNSNEEGKIEIKDLDLDDKLKLVITRDGYHKKEVVVKIKQGLNEIDAIELVRVGKVVYVSNRMGNKNVYASNYDGSGEKMLSDNQGDSYSPYLSSDGKTVKFLSTKEYAKNTYGYVVPLVYSVNIDGGQISKISKTKYEDNNGNLGSYDFESMKRAYVTYDYEGDPDVLNKMYFSNLDGTDVNEVFAFEGGWIGANLIANDGSFIIYSLHGSQDPNVKNGVYYLDTSSKNTVFVHETKEGNNAYPMDISADRKLALVQIHDKSTGKWDLKTLGIFDNTDYRITDTTTSELFARFTPDGGRVSFITNRDNKSDVYVVGINGEGENKISKDGGVDDYFWGNDSLLFFNSDKKMWIVDSNKPKAGQKVTDNVLDTYFSSHYYYEGYWD